MKPYATVPLLAKPNAGMPRLEGGKTIFEMDAKTFASFGRNLVRAGANMIGGCCGTTPAHIQKLSRIIAGIKPKLPVRKSISALSSARGFVHFAENQSLFIVGERINPPVKKALQQELASKETVHHPSDGCRAGKSRRKYLLDINIGQPGIDEVKTIKK